MLDSLPPAHKFLYEYGCFTTFWSSFDLMMDIAICKLKSQQPKAYCLSGKYKASGDKKRELETLLIALNDTNSLQKLQAVFDAAERNDWIHGHILNPHGDFTKLTRLRIDTKNKKITNLTIDLTSNPFEQFYAAYAEFESAICITKSECDQYITQLQT
jgi:hypothetical protein